MNKRTFMAALIMAASFFTVSAQVKAADDGQKTKLTNAEVKKTKLTRAERKALREAEIKEAVDAKRYVFAADRVFPMSGRSRALTSGYDLSVSPDTVTAYLPYFGRAYTAQIGNSEGGIKFLSTDFGYEETAPEKDRREIRIVPKDGTRRYELFLTVFPNGAASLTVNDMQRQTIRFNGTIEQK